MHIIATSVYYLLICSGSSFMLAATGPLPAIGTALLALWARARFGPLNGTQPAGSHGMLDGAVAIGSVFANVAMILMAIAMLVRG